MPSLRGLQIHRASRVERLAERLAAALDAAPPAHPLAAQQIVVAHPGLGSWLRQLLARRRGPDGAPGIAAHLEFLLPGEWLAGLARRHLPADRQPASVWQREALRWRILEHLPTLDAPAVTRYLADDAGGRRAFQLAEHLAALYTQYLIYRRDWIAAAEAGRDDHWQARLWRALATDIAQPHRAGVSAALIEALATGAADAEPPLHLFGVNHLPPDALRALAAFAQHADAHLYFADPCADYWHDLFSERALARAAARGRAAYAEVGHPLLAALARHGQQFNRALDALEPIDDWRDPADEDDADAAALPLLGRLQQSIRRLQPDCVDGPPDPADASLRVHACHTRLRELEVLRDALLDRLAATPDLRPADIVVMAPDIGAYASLIPAVFGPPAQWLPAERGQIPYRIADRALAAQHPLANCFAQLLELPERRFEFGELLAWLAVPAIARRFDFGPGDHAALERWLLRSRVQWGLDGAMKADFCGIDEPQHSWAWALDRLLLGVMVGADPAFDGFDGITPTAPATGPDADALGRLRRLLRLLADGRARMTGRQRLSDWCGWLLGWLDALFEADPVDAAETAALHALRKQIGTLQDGALRADCDPQLGWPAVREALRGALDGAPSQPRFLEGGMTFCGMVPARVVPFRVVAILGLDEAAFPRQPPAPGLNLIAAAPRDGDRDPLAEDRYLFLECLMSARDALHLSYQGEGADDGQPRNPAAPLAELLGFLARRIDSAGQAPPWLLRHALQPFDPRYYGARGDDPRWFSFAAAYALPNDRHATPARRGLLGARWPTASIDDDAPPRSLRELLRFLRQPLRHYCERRLRLRLDILDDDQPDGSESFAPRAAAVDGIESALLERALWQAEPIDPRHPPAWLAGAGLLPPGAPGDAAYRRAARLADAAAQALHERFGATLERPVGRPVTVALDGRERLYGHVRPLLRDAGGWLLPAWRFGRELPLRQQLPLFVRWAALTLAEPMTPVRVEVVTVDERDGRLRVGFSPACAGWSDGPPESVHQRAQHGLRRLLELFELGAVAPLPWLPYSSDACAAADPDQREAKVRQVWNGERDYTPPYPRYLLGDDGPFADDGELRAEFTALAEQIAALLAPASAAEENAA